MISMDEIVGKNDPALIPVDHRVNLFRLHYVSNYIRRLWDHPMVVTSGYRTLEDHRRIYREKNIPEDKIPMKSCHLIGAALDISDPHQKLQEWICDHLHIIEEVGVYLEMFSSTPTWVHMQIFPPKSLNRFFEP